MPIIILLFIQILSFVYFIEKQKFRDLVDGDPSVIIRNGKINEKEMRKQRYNLMIYFNNFVNNRLVQFDEVSFAFLEPSGNLSVFKKEENQPVLALSSRWCNSKQTS